MKWGPLYIPTVCAAIIKKLLALTDREVSSVKEHMHLGVIIDETSMNKKCRKEDQQHARFMGQNQKDCN